MNFLDCQSQAYLRVLHENLEKQKIEICENPDNKTINNLFNLYCNQTSEETNKYIRKKIFAIQKCQTKQELINLLLSQITQGKYLLFHVCHSGTERNPLFQVPQFTFGGLSLPDKSYYTDRVELKPDLLEMISKQLQYFDVVSDSYDFIWNIESKPTHVGSLTKHTGTVSCLEYGNSKLVSGSFDTFVILWNAKQQEDGPLQRQTKKDGWNRILN